MKTYLNTLMKLILPFLMIIGIRCSAPKSQEEIMKFTSDADSLAVHTQKILGKNLISAVKDSGAVFAIEFCNTNANELTQTYTKESKFILSRKAEKVRNSSNSFRESDDINVWESWKKKLANDEEISTVTVVNNQKMTFYKPIKLSMSTCLQCHGSDSDLAPGIKEKLNEVYPDDQATGFKLNELRGMWKVELKN